MIVLLAAAAHAACPSSIDDLRVAVRDAEVAFEALDAQGFGSAVERLDGDLVCVVEPLTPALAAQVHRVWGLRAFLGGDMDTTVEHFASVLNAEPNYEPPAAIAPQGHPLWKAFQDASLVSPQPGLAVDARAGIRVDGAPVESLPGARPYIYQRLEGDAVLATRTYAVGGEPPPWEVAPGPSVTEVARGERGGALPLWISSGVSAIAAGGFLLVASDREQEFFDPATSASELEGLRQETNTYAGLSIGMGAIALGTGVAAVTVTW